MGTLVSKTCLNCAAPLPQGSLSCEFCGSSHVMTADGFQSACQGCGAGNPPHAKHCVQCRAALLIPCPECRADNPLGSRFCHDCTIEFAHYRDPHYQVARNAIPLDAVDARASEWLEGKWFKARDIADNLEILERTLFWLPVWRFLAEARGNVQGQVSQTHYKTVENKRFVPSEDGKGKWENEVDSQPYTVWNDVNRDFEHPVSVVLRASTEEGTAPLYTAVGEPWANQVPLRPLDGELGGAEHERVFEPGLSPGAAWRTLRQEADQQLRATLLEKVTRLDVRYRQPALSLAFYPVWSVLYRYKRKQGTLQLDGVSGRGSGKRISLLTQWLS